MVKPISDRGIVGQVVILYGADFGEKPDLDKMPLAKYPQPSLFTITAKGGNKDSYYYALNDGGGRMITLWSMSGVPGADHLYDAEEWLRWREAESKREISQRDDKVSLLERVIKNYSIMIEAILFRS